MKTNQATFNRPEGSRAIDAPFLTFNIEDLIDVLKDESSWVRNDRNAITLLKTGPLSIVLSCLHKEAEMPDNNVDGYITIQVIDGRINVTTDTDSVELCENKLITIHPNINYSIHALKDTVLLLTHYGE